MTWGDIYWKWVRNGADRADAAYRADEWEKRKQRRMDEYAAGADEWERNDQRLRRQTRRGDGFPEDQSCYLTGEWLAGPDEMSYECAAEQYFLTRWNGAVL